MKFRKRPVLISLGIILVILLPLDLLGGHLMGTYLSDEFNTRNDQDLDDITSDLRTSINMHISVLGSLNSLLTSGDPDDIVENHLEDFSRSQMDETPGIEGIIVLKENGKISGQIRTDSFELENWDILALGFPEVMVGLEKMRNNNVEVVMGPFVFDDIYSIMVTAEPVYHEETLWGFQGIIINLTSIFNEYGLDDPDFDFEIGMKNQEGNIFFGKEIEDGLSTIDKRLELNDFHWDIRAKPKENWFQESSIIVVFFLLGEFLISGLIVIVVYVSATNQMNLNNLVQQRTGELEERTKNLAYEVGIRKDSQKKLEESLKEVNCLLEISHLQLEGLRDLSDVFIKASDILDRSIFTDSKLKSRIRFDGNGYASGETTGEIVYGSVISIGGRRRGWVEVVDQESNTSRPLNEMEKRIVGSVANHLGAIAARWFAEKSEEDARMEAQFYLDLMSHDINNLHQGIMVNLQLIRKGMVKGDMIDNIVGNSSELIDRSINLVRNVKLLSMMKVYDKPLVSIDLDASLEEAVKEVKIAFPKRRIEIEKRTRGVKDGILADNLVEEVFINIINNAVKVQQSDPAIVDIKAFQKDDRIIVSISDHGPGITDSYKPRLFERHTGRRDDKSLSGLGLSLVKVLMDRYRGKVWISDRIKGDHSRGANFNLEFKVSRSSK
jgi:signal transduction histidine kinase